MEQSCLAHFDKSEDDFKKSFESEYIRQIDFETEGELIFFYKKCLDTKLIPNIKKKKLEYGVLISFFHKGHSAEETGTDFIEKFDKKEQAIKFFNDDKEELGFLRKMDKENKLFDGRRYFWLVKGDKIIKKI